MQELRFALRSLGKSPGFVAAVLLTLALGIGINTSTFTVLNAVMFRPLPYPEAGGLVRLQAANPQNFSPLFSPANFLDLRRAATSFSAIVVEGVGTGSLAGADEPAEQVMVASATADFFTMLRTPPLIGRVFTADDEHAGKDNVIILSYRSWMRRYNGNPAALGQVLRLDGRPMTVVGVMPPGFDDILTWGPTDCWRLQIFDDGTGNIRETAWMSVYGRLQSGVSLASAQAELDAIAANLARDHPAINTGLRINATLLDAGRRRGQGAAFNWLIMGLSASVLLIACANLANLQLSRALTHERDHAIRLALGASRARLIRLVLTESVLLSLIGAPLGLLIALWSNDLISRNIPIGRGEYLPMNIDWRVLGFAIVTAALTGIAFGLMPALFSARTDVNRALKLGSASASSDRSRRRLRDGLIVAEIVLSLVLLVGASFFVRGLVRITDRDLGWNPDGLMTGGIALPYSKFKDDAACLQFFQRLEAELAALPGVQHAALATAVPTFGTAPQFVSPEAPAEGAAPNQVPASMNDVSSDYFAAAGIALVRGRTFAPGDRQGAPAVAIINETMARLLWPGQDPVGRRVNVGGNNRPGPHEIVGVVRDSQPATNFTPNQAMEIYRPIAQAPTHWPSLLVRAAGEPTMIARPLRAAVQRIDPDLAILNLSPARADLELVGSSTRTISFAVSFFSAFGLLLAALGVYGVIARLVHQRTREIGVRLALGAAPGDVLMLVLRHGMRLALLGCALGVAGGIGAVRLCAAVVPGYPGVDWLWFSVAVLGVLAITLLACWLPARRATRVNPIVALRAE